MFRTFYRRPRRTLVRASVILTVVVGILVSIISPASAAALGTTPRELANGQFTTCLYQSYPTNTSSLHLNDCSSNGSDGDIWKGNDDYTIRNTLTGYCLTTTANAPGTTVTAATAAVCNGSAYQEWSYSFVGNPAYQVVLLHNLGNDWYLDTNGSSIYTHVGTPGDVYQEWVQVF